MLNLIRMNLYRIRHSLSSWCILFFTVAAAVFSVAMTNLYIASMEADASGAEASAVEAAPDFGITVSVNPEWADGTIEMGDIVSTEIGSRLLAILCTIFTAIFITGEQKSGYIKNIAGHFPGRWPLVLAKFAALAFWLLLMLLVFTVSVLLSGLAFWGGRFQMGSFPALAEILGVQYLLHLGLSSLLMLLCILTGSSAVGMTAGILLCCGAGNLIYSLVNRMADSLHWGRNFDVSLYTPDGNIPLAVIGAAPSALLRAALVGCAFTAASVLLSVLIMKKRDIR